ncbi:MAG: proprotein convertase P-domain-containing protein, partial [Xanthomonadaceae bacterium]|nr:proprotein convertase P-domain-containing protein [Xanthomonadaceae bacterium]
AKPLNGTWNLRVNDNAAGDTGRIDSWSITF